MTDNTMNITKDTKLKDILTEYPWLRDELMKKYEKFRLLDTIPGRLFLKTATVEDLSKKAGKAPEELIDRLNGILAEHQGK